ncbi:MAG: zf-HC2 domain-containing protein [Gemmatimonadales bacterium]
MTGSGSPTPPASSPPPPAEEHEHWVRQIDAELDGELSLLQRVALARHLATCTHCAGARASHLELRAAIASAAGDPHARTVPRPVIRGRTLALAVIGALIAGAALGWALHARWGGPGGGRLEESRATIVAR